jgi:hypothetical protein
MGSSACASERALAVSGLASHRGADCVRCFGRLEARFEVGASLEERPACQFRKIWAR